MDLTTKKPIFGLASDLHLDFQDMHPDFFQWRGDVLLLAGDIGEEDFLRKSRNDSFWDRISEMAPQVFMISGNHEHYRSEIDKTDEHLREHLKRWPNIRLLKNEAVDLGYVVLYGSTMWTNYGGNPLSALTAQSEMNDYKQIRVAHKGFRKLNTNDVLLEHGYATNGLQNALDAYPDRPFLVMTHHAPSHQSVHPAYKTQGSLNDAYCNRFERLIENEPRIQAWVHGHIHWFLNYDIAGCYVLCNPRGYPGERPDHLPPYRPLSFQLEI